MLGFKKTNPTEAALAQAQSRGEPFHAEAPEEAIQVAVLEKPQPIKVTLPDVTRHAEYEELAASLGYEPREITERKHLELRREVLEFILDNGWPVFDNEKVQTFLQGLADNETEKVYGWRPPAGDTMRWNDRRPWIRPVWVPLAGQKAAVPTTVTISSGFVGSVSHGQAGYDKLIPIDILKRVKATKDKFGDKVWFTVSDYESVQPDPFVAVNFVGSMPIIFGVWNEPGWGI